MIHYKDMAGNDVPSNLITDYLVSKGFVIVEYKVDGYVNFRYSDGLMSRDLVITVEDLNNPEVLDAFSTSINKTKI